MSTESTKIDYDNVKVELLHQIHMFERKGIHNKYRRFSLDDSEEVLTHEVLGLKECAKKHDKVEFDRRYNDTIGTIAFMTKEICGLSLNPEAKDKMDEMIDEVSSKYKSDTLYQPDDETKAKMSMIGLSALMSAILMSSKNKDEKTKDNISNDNLNNDEENDGKKNNMQNKDTIK